MFKVTFNFSIYILNIIKQQNKKVFFIFFWLQTGNLVETVNGVINELNFVIFCKTQKSCCPELKKYII